MCQKDTKYYADLNALHSFKTSGNTNPMTQHHIPKDLSPHAGNDCSNFITNTRAVLSAKM
jgi:hypothetical protein